MADLPGLVEACDDRRLFPIDLWPQQRELLEAIEAGPRTVVLALGRRASKTTMSALVGLWCCLLRPELLKRLRPGERGYCVAIAVNQRQSRLLLAAAKSIVSRSALKELVEAETDDEIRFKNGTAFAAFPCTSRGGRGFPIFCLLLDELAHFVDTEGNSAAESVWRALSPATAQFGSLAKVVAASTPYGSGGFFAELFARASSGELPEALAFRAASSEVNPTLEAAFLESERVALGAEAFAGEYEADFVGSGGAFLDGDVLEDAVVDRDELSPGDASGWVAGLDPAFSSDPFGLAIVGRDVSSGRLRLGVARRWLPVAQRSFEERDAARDAVLAEVAEVCLYYRARVVTDQFAAPAVVDRLRRAGLSVTTEPMTATSKSLVFSELRARLAAGDLELYRQPDLLVELRRLRSQFTAGRANVVNPRVGDSHGDVAQALGMAVWAQRLWHGGSGARSLSSAAQRLPASPGLMDEVTQLAHRMGVPVTSSGRVRMHNDRRAT